MSITHLEIENFLVFYKEFAMDFCPGINVITGGNGTGKTTLLKILYAFCNISTSCAIKGSSIEVNRLCIFKRYFAPSKWSFGAKKRAKRKIKDIRKRKNAVSFS